MKQIIVFELIAAIKAFHKLQEMHLDAGKLQKKAGLFNDLKSNASNKGFEIVGNDGKGNCMFHALCDQLKYKKHLEISHQELRKELVKYLREHPTMVSVNKGESLNIIFIIKPDRAHCPQIQCSIMS